MRLGIIDCGAGNLHSVEKAVRRATGVEPQIITDSQQVDALSHIILPGVGAFADCMAGLNALDGMVNALKNAVFVQKTPFLGICVGMQLLFERGHEHGTHAGLGWLEGEVVALAPSDASLKIPHMGWNNVTAKQAGHALLNEIDEQPHMYFVHSYCVQPQQQSDVLLSSEYGGELVAAVARENVMGTQFHPEKSQRAGLQLLQNFAQMGT